MTRRTAKALVVPAVATAVKSVEQAAEQSVQPRAQDKRLYGQAGILHYLSAGSYRVAPWWSPQRDLDLDAFWKDSDEVSGALALLSAKVTTVPVQVQPRDTRLTQHVRDAEKFNIILNEEAEFGRGWIHMLSKWLLDYWLSDNGAFLEVIGPGDPTGPIEGQPTGIAHLDSHRVQRTGNQEFPALYRRPDGGHVKLHRSRIVMLSDMPSPREEMFGVGFCALSRAIHHAQHLMDLATYKEEKLGSRPKRGILVGKNIATDTILDAMAIADESMDSRNLSIYSQLAVLGNLPADADLSVLDLVGLPDGFDEDTSNRLGMFTLALAFGVPIRWIWPASVSGATKADAMYQHIAGLGGGIGRILSMLTLALGGDPRGSRHAIGKFLPPHLKLVFDFQDDEQDDQRATIAGKRAGTLKTQLEVGLLDMRAAREHALAAGDLTQAQFDRLELADGRLPDGSDVIGLFHVDDEPFMTWLDLGVDSPLSVSANDALTMLSEIDRAAVNVQDVVANTNNIAVKSQAEQALAALSKLKELYAPLAQQSVQRDIMAQFGGPPTVATSTIAEPLFEKEEEAAEPAEAATAESEAAPPPTEQLEAEEKSFNYGVSAGEIIGGQLARGVGGRFINAAELRSAMQQTLLARMGRVAQPSANNRAATARAKNRAELSEQLGVDLEALAGMINGTTPSDKLQALVQKGLAEANPDGSITMTAAGRTLLAAVNKGDLDAARAALAKAAPKAKGGGGKGGSKSPEEKQREREEAQRQLQQQNRQTVIAGLAGRLSQSAFDALNQFAEGQEIELENVQELAQQGLIEIDAKGNARMTPIGSQLVNAGNKGDLRAAKDALSAGAERVRTILQRAADTERTAASYEQNITAARRQGEQQAQQYAAAAAELQAQRTAILQPYLNQAAQLEARAAEDLAEATALDQQALEYDQEVERLTEALRTAPTEQVRATLQTQLEATTNLAARAREQAQAARERADAAATQGLDVRERMRKADEQLTERIQQYLSGAEAARKAGADAAEAWLERAERLREQVREWRNSVGNAAPPVATKLLQRLFGGHKAAAVVSPVPTAADVKKAVAEWDANMPPEARGLLSATKTKPGKR